MLVKKIDPEWQPAENRGLRVGETIDISDPRQLILDKKCVGVGPAGEELGPFELYGEIQADDRTEFAKWKEMIKQQALQKKLEEEQAKLKAEADKIAAEANAKKAEEPKAKEKAK